MKNNYMNDFIYIFLIKFIDIFFYLRNSYINDVMIGFEIL